MIFVGLKLIIPAAPEAARAATPANKTATVVNRLHTVQPGETLFGIALKYGTTVRSLLETNRLDQAGLIVPGQLLIIPADARSNQAGIAQPATPLPAPFTSIEIGPLPLYQGSVMEVKVHASQPVSLPVDASFRASLGTGEGDRLVLAGSTHAGEEEMLVAAYRKMVSQYASTVLMLAPRHIERAEEVVVMVKAAGLPVQRKSRFDSVGSGPRVIILDTRGELARAYHEATVAFVGGTLDPVGGHNLLEPAVWGKPVLDSVPIRTIARKSRRTF